MKRSGSLRQMYYWGLHEPDGYVGLQRAAAAMDLLAIRDQECVARILGVSRQAVQATERRAIMKLRRGLRSVAIELGIVR